MKFTETCCSHSFFGDPLISKEPDQEQYPDGFSKEEMERLMEEYGTPAFQEKDLLPAVRELSRLTAPPLLKPSAKG